MNASRLSLTAWMAALAVSVTLSHISGPWHRSLSTLFRARYGSFDSAEPARQSPRVERLAGPVWMVVSAPHGRRYTISEETLNAEEADGRIEWSFTLPPPARPGSAGYEPWMYQDGLGTPVVGDDGTSYLPSASTLRAFTEKGEIKWSSIDTSEARLSTLFKDCEKRFRESLPTQEFLQVLPGDRLLRALAGDFKVPSDHFRNVCLDAAQRLVLRPAGMERLLQEALR